MTLVFSLIGGLLIAVVLQLVFANLGIALGLTLLDFSPRHSVSPASDEASSDETESDESESDESEEDESDFSLPITHLLGFGVAVGLSMVIFTGTLLSVEFSGLLEPRRGIIFGLVFWSTYWLLFIWLCSTTVTGIADSLIGGAIASGKRLITTVKQSATGSNSGSDSSVEKQTLEQQIIIKELAAEVSRLASAQNEVPRLLANQSDALLAQINAAIEEKLDEEKSDPLTPSGHSKTEITVTETDQTSAPDVSISKSSSSMLSQLDLPSWQQIAKSAINQVDLSDWDVATLLEQFSRNEQEDSSKDKTKPKAIASQIVGSAIALLPDTSSSSESSESPSDNQSDTSEDFSVHNSAASHVSTEYGATIQTIQTKLEDYCRYTNVSSLTPDKLSEKVGSLLQEYDLSIEAIGNSQLSVDIASLESVLSRRQNLSSQSKQQLIETLEEVWPSVSLAPAPTAESIAADIPDLKESANKDGADKDGADKDGADKESADQEGSDDLSVQSIAEKAYQTVESHLQAIDWDAVSLEDIKPEVNTLLSQLEREGSLGSIDWQALVSRVQVHHDVKEDFTDWLKTALTNQLRSARPAVIHTAKDLSQQFSERITDYLRNREKPDLHPEKAAKELSHMVGGAIASLPHPANLNDLTVSDISFSQVLWDKTKWQQALESRKDMSAEEIHQIIEWGEQVWQPKAEQIGGWLRAVQAEASKHLSLSDLSLPDMNLPSISLPDLNLPDKDSVVTAGQQINEQITTVQAAVSGQITSVKEDIRAQVTAVKEDIQEQVDGGRRQIAIAAWWLFIAFVLSGSAAAGAGWLAANY